MQSQLGYALMVARRSNRSGTSVDELLAEGSLGLIQAANRFDPERGYRFFTYAKHWVHVYISKWATRRSGGMVYNSKRLRKVNQERARAFSLVGDGLAARRLIAERLNLSDDEVDASLGALEAREVSFDAVPPEQITTLVRPDEPDPEQTLLQRAERVRCQSLVSEVLRTLDARERRIVAERLMVDREGALTLEQLGKEFGVSRERVRQLEERLKHKLARELGRLAEPKRCAVAA